MRAMRGADIASHHVLMRTKLKIRLVAIKRRQIECERDTMFSGLKVTTV